MRPRSRFYFVSGQFQWTPSPAFRYLLAFDGVTKSKLENGNIKPIGPVDEVPIPEDARVIDGTDRYLMPGLAEMQAHVPEIESPKLGRDFSLYVANGVTTIREANQQIKHNKGLCVECTNHPGEQK